jgi:hypothetical protein
VARCSWLAITERLLSRIPRARSTAAAFFMLVAITGINHAAVARAADLRALLNDVARVYSLGVGEVRCPSQPEWDADPHRTTFSWGYTNVRRDYTVLPPMICAGAMSVGSVSVPTWQQAAGAWMLVHEAFHLRHWRFRRNEAKVGCQTIVYFTDAGPIGRVRFAGPAALPLWPRAPRSRTRPLPVAPRPEVRRAALVSSFGSLAFTSSGGSKHHRLSLDSFGIQSALMTAYARGLRTRLSSKAFST